MKKISFLLTNVFLFAAAYAGFYQGVENAQKVVIGLCWLAFVVAWILSSSKEDKIKLEYAEKRTMPNYVYILSDVAMIAILMANNCWFTALAVLFHMHLINDTLEQVKRIKEGHAKTSKLSGSITF